MLMYVFLSPTFSCVVSFLPLYICFLLLVCNLLFLSHTKMPWWVLFKMFQKYRLSKSICHKLSSCNVFQEFVLGQTLLYSTSEYELSDLWLLSYVHFLCNWLIFWQNALYLYLGRSRMCVNTLRNCVLRSSVEIIKSVQETSEEVLSF